MIEVEARIYYWTPEGMRLMPVSGHSTGYIEQREVERLLEEADLRRLKWAQNNARDLGDGQ